MRLIDLEDQALHAFNLGTLLKLVALLLALRSFGEHLLSRTRSQITQFGTPLCVSQVHQVVSLRCREDLGLTPIHELPRILFHLLVVAL